jgi:hypothetical protein
MRDKLSEFYFKIELKLTNDDYLMHADSHGNYQRMIMDFAVLLVVRPELIPILEDAIKMSKSEDEDFKEYVDEIKFLQKI